MKFPPDRLFFPIRIMGNALLHKRNKTVNKMKVLDRDIILIDGFIRDIDNFDLSQEWIIPKCINDLCLIFYFQLESFQKFSNDCLYDKVGNIIRKENKKRETVYGDIVINGYNTGIYKWKIRILNITKAPLYIGIDSNIEQDINIDFSDPDLNRSIFYAIGQYRNKYSSDIRGQEYGDRIWKKNDIITIIIDTTKIDPVFKAFVNDRDQGIAFDGLKLNKKKEYRLALSIGDKSAIQIHDFECVPSK